MPDDSSYGHRGEALVVSKNLSRQTGPGKIFLNNGRVTGLFHTIGEPTPTRIIAEGYATAATIHEATGFCVHIAFNCVNLKAVAKTIREQHPNTDLVIAADDDWKTDGNPGLTHATAAAKAAGAALVRRMAPSVAIPL